MGKVTLEFDSLEEAEDIRNALDGWKWKMVACDLDEELRRKLKYAELTEEQYIAYETVRNELREMISGYNLKLE
jgi:hypothetical protein